MFNKKNAGGEKPAVQKADMKSALKASAQHHASRRGAFSAGLTALAVDVYKRQA